jgi:hypothetical protein
LKTGALAAGVSGLRVDPGLGWRRRVEWKTVDVERSFHPTLSGAVGLRSHLKLHL